MTRDANIFYWRNTDWKPLEFLFKTHEDCTLQNKVAIYQTFNSLVPYTIVSISEKVDKIIIRLGGEPILENDYLILVLTKSNKDPLFGDKNLMHFLNWPLKKNVFNKILLS